MAADPGSFSPFPVLRGPHLQTIAAAKLRLWRREPPGQVQVVTLPDGDRIALVISTPPQWRPDGPSVLLLHGLCGCHQSSYMMRLALKLWRCGIRAIRMNMRGCGAGVGLARQPYHSGRSPDVLAVLEDLQQQWPESPMTLLGFSLGGNVMLKLAGELGQRAETLCTQVIAVCPPADLAACSRLLSQPSNRLYERYFMRRLLAAVAERHRLYPDLAPVNLPERLSLYRFDNLYTAPQCGFADADDYYARSSAAPWVPQITLPCRILFANDDPVIDAAVFDGAALPANVEVVRTPQGGHMGFLGRPGRPGGYRWMDACLLDWIGVA